MTLHLVSQHAVQVRSMTPCSAVRRGRGWTVTEVSSVVWQHALGPTALLNRRLLKLVTPEEGRDFWRSVVSPFHHLSNHCGPVSSHYPLPLNPAASQPWQTIRKPYAPMYRFSLTHTHIYIYMYIYIYYLYIYRYTYIYIYRHMYVTRNCCGLKVLSTLGAPVLNGLSCESWKSREAP